MKTGTSSLQQWLRHGETLHANGYHFSRAAGGRKHFRLVAFAEDDAKRNERRAGFGVRSAAELKAFRARFEEALAAEVRKHPDRTFIFSEEDCHADLSSPAEVQRLHDLLAAHFEEVRIVVYLRRQDRFAVSNYTTSLMFAATHETIIPEEGESEPALDYFTALGRWADAFGKQSLTIRLYDEVMRKSGSIIADFADLLGFEAPATRGRRINTSLQPSHQEFLRQINLHWPRDPGKPRIGGRRELAFALFGLGAGPGRMPSRVQAKDYYDRFRDSNEALRREYFPDRATLFDEDFDDYPVEDPGVPCLDHETMFAIFARLWAQGSLERARLRSDLAAARSEIDRLQGPGGRASSASPDSSAGDGD
jgi:hypothetical protein